MSTFATQRLSGWGRFPVEECGVYRPEKRREVQQVVRTHGAQSLIARGLGRSYGDAAINGGGDVLDFSRLDRMIAFDADTGMLECEGGVSLADLLETFVPRGFFLSVLPGTKFVTVGGAIANDIHGKNHHRDGTFSQFVESLQLLLANGEVLTCSPDANPEVFWATVGGIGLTGIILSARLRLQRVESAYVAVDYFRARNIEEALATMVESDERYQYSVGWVDCQSKGAALGRSVLMRGNHAVRAAVSGSEPFRVRPSLQKTVPIDFPAFVLNPLTIRAFNEVYYALHRTAPGKLVDYDSYFCPLDSIHHWNRMYGKRGFTQYQVTFPTQNSRGLIELLELVSRTASASFLAVLKRMGPSGPGMLSYPSEGYTITFDIPMRPEVIPMLRRWDEMVLKYDGRLYCAKDVCTLPGTFAQMYPRLDEFRAVKTRLDPNNLFSSTMSRRLGIVEPPAGGPVHV